MNKLEQLFATKSQIEAELEAERQAAQREEDRKRTEKVLAEEQKRQEQADDMIFGHTKVLAEAIKAVVGDKINNPDFMLYLVCMLFLWYDKREHENVFKLKLEGLNRKYTK